MVTDNDNLEKKTEFGVVICFELDLTRSVSNAHFLFFNQT